MSPLKDRTNRSIDYRHQFRLVLFGHKAIESAAVCAILMVQGQIPELAVSHVLIAAKTGTLATVPLVLLTWTRHVRHLINRWTASVLLGVLTAVSDLWIHASHYPGATTEALLTGVGAFLFSLAVSFTAVGRWIDRRAEAFILGHGGAISVTASRPAGLTLRRSERE